MASGLEIRMLGGFDVVLDGRPVTEFEAASTRALLARLAADAGTHVARSELAEMLWPDREAGRAIANLRHTLAVLRRAIGDRGRDRPLVQADRETIVLAADVADIDLVEFRRLALTSADAHGAVASWKRAVALRRGPFLDGFEPSLSESWDTWCVTRRAMVDTLARGALVRLADLRERTGEREQALAHARALVGLDPWDESAHVRMVRLLAADGRRAAALEHADHYASDLRDQLDVEPGVEFANLVRCLREDRGRPAPVALPELGPRPHLPAGDTCVARDRELAWLDQRLDDAVAGTGGTVFVSGSAGAGKSVLLRAFARDAGARMRELCVLTGACNAYNGPGDPLLPFRQALGLLCGDIEAAWSSGMIAEDDAGRLVADLPDVADTLLDLGPSLLGTVVDSPALLRRLEYAHPGHSILAQLQRASDDADRRASDPTRRRRPLLDQYVRVMARLATRRPILMIIDDLHWADTGTLELLRYFGGRLTGVPLLIVAAFRPSEVAQHDRRSEQIVEMIDEARSHSAADCLLELQGSRTFIDALLDARPNLLGAEFRDALFASTHGHALFTVETVTALRERGDIELDDRDRWVMRGSVSLGVVAPRIEATIESRLRGLTPKLRRDIEVASVQGDSFLTSVVATVLGEPVVDVVTRLAGLASTPSALIEPAGTEHIGDARVDRHRFRHSVIRHYVYDHITAPDREALHEATGRALAEAFADRLDDVAVDLAQHFEHAGMLCEAVEHHDRAARSAIALSATDEAIHHLERALQLLTELDRSSDRDGHELALASRLGACLQASDGYSAHRTLDTYERVRSLLAVVDPSLESAAALGGLIAIDGLRARYSSAIESAAQLLLLAARLEAPPIEAIARVQLGWLQLMVGQPGEAISQLDQALDDYDESWDDWLTYAVGFQVGSTALAWRAVASWYVGRFDQVQRDAESAIARAREVGYPYAIAFAVSIAGCVVSELLLDAERVVDAAREVAEIADRQDFAFYRAAAEVHLGIGMALGDDVDEGLSRLDGGLAAWSELGTEAFTDWIGCQRAEFLVAAGRFDEAEADLARIDHRIEVREERIAAYWLPIARAKWLRGRGEDGAARRVLGDAVEAFGGVAGPRLRTALALADLLENRPDEIRRLLVPLIASLPDGANPEVRTARRLLGALPDRGDA